MTVIFAATYVDGAMVGADRKRHNATTLQAVGDAKKTVRLTSKAVAAKAGFGPSADHIWNVVRSRISSPDADASEVAEIIEQVAPNVLSDCRRAAGPLGVGTPLQFLIAGFSGGAPSIHAIQAEQRHRLDLTGPGEALALGVRQETNSRARKMFFENYGGGIQSTILDLENWARSLVVEERASAPHSVGFPVDVAVLGADGLREILLRDLSSPSP